MPKKYVEMNTNVEWFFQHYMNLTINGKPNPRALKMLITILKEKEKFLKNNIK